MFSSLCEWFVGNQLTIHFREDKTKSILFNKAKSLMRVTKIKPVF